MKTHAAYFVEKNLILILIINVNEKIKTRNIVIKDIIKMR